MATPPQTPSPGNNQCGNNEVGAALITVLQNLVIAINGIVQTIQRKT